jgi:hypothetical protein
MEGHGFVWKKLQAVFLYAKAAHLHSNWLKRHFAGSKAEYRSASGFALHLSMEGRLIQLAQDIGPACRYSEQVKELVSSMASQVSLTGGCLLMGQPPLYFL